MHQPVVLESKEPTFWNRVQLTTAEGLRHSERGCATKQNGHGHPPHYVQLVDDVYSIYPGLCHSTLLHHLSEHVGIVSTV